MDASAQLILFLVVLTDFAVLGMSRLSACIRAIAVQGTLLGILPVMLFGFSTHTVSLGVGTIIVKGAALPTFLRWAIREAKVRREVEPLVGYMTSVMLGTAARASAFAVSDVLRLNRT
jgi:hydrogenase-4 component E